MKALSTCALSCSCQLALIAALLSSVPLAAQDKSSAQTASRNLIAPQSGGTVVWFTSRDPKSELAQLTDGKVDTAGWRSRDDYLPQDFVFAFEKDALKPVGKLVLNPKSSSPKTTWASNFVVSVSLETPLSGFEDVGEFSLLPAATNQEFIINRPAKFIKLRIVSNGGSNYTSLGEIQVQEGDKDLLKTVAQTAQSKVDAVLQAAAKPELEATPETEPNNRSGEAILIEPGARIKGTIDPPGEEDRFKVRVLGTSPSVITFELTGRPNIRTSLNLIGPDETPIKRFDPAKVMAESVSFSWSVSPGDYVVQLTEPPVSMVMIWDTSESMKQSIGDLQKAVEAYLDEVRPGERLKLMRFSRDVEVITPEFLSDPIKLKEASKGKFATRQGTSLYDAVVKGLQLLDGIPGNRAIVLMTDGSDSSSQLDHPGFWKMLQEKGVRLYNIGLGGGMKRYAPTTGTVCERVLTHAALASNGRYFTANNSDELKGFYQQIAKELRSTSTYYLSARVSQGNGRLNVIATGEPIAAVSAAPQVEIILDASGSMKDFSGSKRKIEIARQALSQIVQELPDDTRIALRLYGHRLRPGEPGECEDTELVFPFGKVDKTKIIQTIQKVTAIGNTPIAYSLRQVPKDFENVPGEKVVVLATDGKEDCNGKPLEAVEELMAKGLKFRLEIIGLALNEKKATSDMQQLAALTGGKFYQAKDAKSLAQAFQSSLAVRYDVLDADGATVASGMTSQSDLAVPEGIFTVVLHGDQPITVPNVRINSNRLTRVALKKQAQQIAIDVQAQ